MSAPITWDDDFELEVERPLDAPDDDEALRAAVADKLSVLPADLPPLEVRRRAIDARARRVRFHLTIGARPATPPPLAAPLPREVAGEPVIVVGAGPAGLYCAYELARAGVASIVIDRGKLVQARRRDLKGLNQHGKVDPDSNYCFGEGGAGTYSDGKLYTRAHKRGDVRDVIEILALHGAPERILVDARPHIGSNRLPKVLTAMRERLVSLGVRFELPARVTSILVEEHAGRRRAAGVRLADGRELTGRAVVIATGHSARDVWPMLADAGVALEAKPFALGVRVEHPQGMVDRAQYGGAAGHPKLAAAAYRLAHTTDGAGGPRGVFSFCMCPGGWIVPAATEPDGVVVNGMSLSRRDSPFANSGVVVAVELADLAALGLGGPMAGVELQRRLEVAAATAGGGALRAPATRVSDFLARRGSTTVPASSYQPGLHATDVAEVLAASGLPLADRLRTALARFDQQLRGYASAEGVMVGVESRTSSPVRVPRDAATLQAPSLPDLYPSGEGAGYAGGIVSAALDGIRVARAICAAAVVLALGACDLLESPATPDAAVDASGLDGYPLPQRGVVPAIGTDATLDVACWNIENYPAIELTPALVADLITSLDLDLIVVEEIANVAAFDELIARLPEHEAVLSSHRYTPTSYQKIGLIYRTPLVAIGTHELVFTADGYAFPRPILKVPVTVGPLTFDVMGLHLKAGGEPSDHDRRAAAARDIDLYLRDQLERGGEDEVIVLGDYNDVIDTAEGRATLAPLLDPDRYRFRTDAAVAAGARSFLHGSRVIDHIMTTAGLAEEVGGATAVIPALDVQYANYEPIISDHLPVILSFPLPR